MMCACGHIRANIASLRVKRATSDTVVGYLWFFKREIPAPIEQNEIFINVIEVIYTSLRCQGVAFQMISEIIKIAK